jgi:cytidine deaminase
MTNTNKPVRPSGVASKRVPRKLLEAARHAAQSAYAPYSGFSVGAAVETSDGRIFLGANMENASYGLTMCAEVGAIQAASTAGLLNKIRRIAIVGGPTKEPPQHIPRPTAPCGRCRQLIAEAAVYGGYDVEVWFADLDGKVVERRTISALLPDSFGSGNLGR